MNEYAYPHSEEVQHQHGTGYRPERFSAVELLGRHVAGPFYDLHGYEMDMSNGAAVQFLERCVSGALEAATYAAEQGWTPDPDQIATDTVGGLEAMVYTLETWAVFVGLKGWNLAEELDGDDWQPHRLTDEARSVVGYAGWTVARWAVEVFDWEGLD